MGQLFIFLLKLFTFSYRVKNLSKYLLGLYISQDPEDLEDLLITNYFIFFIRNSF